MDKLYILDLGRMGYRKAWDLQKAVHQKRVDDKIPDTLILVEHDPVVTMGKSGKEKNLLIPRQLLKDKGVDFFNIERGGDVTYHGPGQLVGYPIFNIRKGLAGIKPFISRIEDAIVLTLKDFGIPAQKKEKLIGVWTETGKICSIGVAVQRWVSFHGFALNVNTDLNFFNFIVPCGLAGVKMTSMKEILKKEIGLEEVKNGIRKRFGVLFGKDIEATCLNAII
jgi:lipoate-protein ligase B